MPSIDLQHGQVGARIGADELGVKLLAAVHYDGEFGAALDHVIVGDEIAVLGNEEARALGDRARTVIAATLAALGAAAVLVVKATELLEEALHRVVVGQILEAAAEHLNIGVGGRLDLGLDANADDGRRHALDDVGETRSLGRFDANRLGENGNGA